MARALDTVLNEANPNKIASALQAALVGKALRQNCAQYFTGAPVSNVLVLPESAKAGVLLSVVARTGTVVGTFTPVNREATPATTQAAVNQLGNIGFLPADAVTQAEVIYLPQEGDVIQEEIVVPAAGTGAFLQGRRATILLEAELLTGTVVGVKTVLVRSNTAPATLQARLNLAGQPVFLAADVGATPARARVKYIAAPGIGTGVKTSLLTRLLSLVGM